MRLTPKIFLLQWIGINDLNGLSASPTDLVLDFFNRSDLPSSSRFDSCWACLSTLPLKLNLRFLFLGQFFTSTCLACFLACTPRLIRSACLLLRPSSAFFLPLRLRCPLIYRSSHFGFLLVWLVSTWFGSTETSPFPFKSIVSDSSYSSALLLTLVDTCSGSSSPLLFFPSDLPLVVPLKCGTSRCCSPSIFENDCNLWDPSGLVKMSETCRSVRMYRSSTSRLRTCSCIKW